MILRAWARVSVGGLPPGFAQVMWAVRAVCSVVNCWWLRPVIGLWGNGSSGAVLRIFVVIYPQFFAAGGVVV